MLFRYSSVVEVCFVLTLREALDQPTFDQKALSADNTAHNPKSVSAAKRWSYQAITILFVTREPLTWGIHYVSQTLNLRARPLLCRT